MELLAIFRNRDKVSQKNTRNNRKGLKKLYIEFNSDQMGLVHERYSMSQLLKIMITIGVFKLTITYIANCLLEVYEYGFLKYISYG